MRKSGLFVVALLLLGNAAQAQAQEVSCAELLVQCGDGPGHVTTENKVMSFVGGGNISTQCVGVISGVLSSYKFCHGNLTWAGAGAVLSHFVHSNPKFLKLTAWECAKQAYAAAFPCDAK